jgi:hypothetical protein
MCSGVSAFRAFYDPRVGSFVETHTWGADALITRNADFLEARNIRLRQLFTGEGAL